MSFQVQQTGSALEQSLVGLYGCDFVVAQLLLAQVANLSSANVHAGAQVVPVTIPDLELVRVAQTAVVSSEAAQGFKWALNNSKWRRKMGLDVQFTFKTAGEFTAVQLVQVRSQTLYILFLSMMSVRLHGNLLTFLDALCIEAMLWLHCSRPAACNVFG